MKTDISKLKVMDVLVEHNPAGYEMPVMVCKDPIKKGNVWIVKTITRAAIYYEYRQMPDGIILNNCDQETKLELNK